MLRWKFLGAVITLLAGTQAVSQEVKNELDGVTVTATLTPEKASRTGRNLVVIKGETIAHLPVHSIDELIRYLPGIEVQARGPMGTQSDFVVRGGTFQQVLILLDGVRLNDPNSGHFASYIPVTPGEIDRIEILKGASSALYGSEAVGGVIQIVTKTFAAGKQAASNLNAQINAGEFGLINGSIDGSVNTGNTMVSAGILSNNAKGQQQRGTKGFFHNHTATVAWHQYLASSWQLALRSSYDDRKFAAQNFYTSFISDTAEEQVKTVWNQVQLTHQGTKDALLFSVGYKHLNDRYAYNAVSIANQSNSNLFQALLTDRHTINDHTNLTFGTQFINKSIASNDRGEHSVKQAAGFGSFSFSLFNDRLTVNPALRLEWNERSGWEWVPQANVSWRKDAWQLRASAGKTIRDADFTERFNNYNKPFVASGRLGNPDLEAERSFSYEAGADWFSRKALKVSVTAFQRNHNRLIDYVTTPYSEIPRKDNLSPSGSYALAKNIARVRTRGAEADLLYAFKMADKKQAWASVGLVWLDSKSSDSQPSLYLSSHARFLANFNLSYQGRWVVITVNGVYKTRQPQTAAAPAIAKLSESYFVMNAKVEGYLLQRRLSLFAEADNIWNRHYADLLGSVMPERWLMGGIKISLSK
ncbi:MAG TPA: TonB-dependent receptor [Flavisolibacter sp.]|jgi:iron complex outermembrane receptor protein|nr:TonB-dependent receptor [Flavisolibacter sp.]